LLQKVKAGYIYFAVRVREENFRKKCSEGIEISRTSKDFLLDIASSCVRGRALDIGCGTGINASKLDSLGFKVSGVDLSETAIKKFKEQGYDCFIATAISPRL
jgi:2-polyprenyl-3-methyl-5-hydroxy-6-metoxy-1,4-benzoquinol methylase